MLHVNQGIALSADSDSFAPDSSVHQGAILEPQLGPSRYAALLLELLVLSHGMVLVLARAIATVAPSWSGVYYRCVLLSDICGIASAQDRTTTTPASRVCGVPCVKNPFCNGLGLSDGCGFCRD